MENSALELVCMGVLIMDMFPAENGKRLAEVSAYRPAPGGAPANVAAAAARLGVRSAFIGKVGEDAFGHFLAGVLEREGVDIRGVRYDGCARTTMNFHAKPETGGIEYLFYRNPGADTTLREDELEPGLLERAKVLHLDSLCLTGEPVKTTTLKAVQTARTAGVLISFDVNYRSVLWDSPEQAAGSVRDLLGKVDILKLNEEELALLCGARDIGEAAESLLDRGPKLCLVTLGPRGSYIATKRGGRFVPALEVEVLDPIGCGDAYIGGFLSAFIRTGAPLDELTQEKLGELAEYADTVAALTAIRNGALPALPRGEEVARLFAERRIRSC